MFDRPTVFVVGAGCSVEFGFPTGPALMGQIDDLVLASLRGGTSFLDAYFRISADKSRYRSHLQTFSRGLHGSPSIDQYLSFNADDKEVETIGKLAIAQIILAQERNSKLGRKAVTHGLREISSTWIMRLFQLMALGAPKGQLDRAFSNVSFICFNYDRCIETALHLALMHYGRLSGGEAKAMLAHLPIWHPYGSVGKPIDDASGGFSERPLDPSEVVHSAAGIRTFTEGMADTGELGKMREALHQADQIVFLGFSYGKDNMKLLGPGQDTTAKIIVANTYLLAPSASSLAREACARSLYPNRTGVGRERVFRTATSASDVVARLGPALRDGLLAWQVTQGHLAEAHEGVG